MLGAQLSCLPAGERLPLLGCLNNVASRWLSAAWPWHPQAAEQRIPTHLHLPSVRSCTNIVARPNKPGTYVQLLTAIKASRDIGRLRRLCAEYGDRFDAVHAAAALARMPKVVEARQWHNDERLAERLSTLVPELLAKLEGFKDLLYARQISCSVWAVGRLAAVPDFDARKAVRPLLDDLASDSYRKLFQSGNPADISQLYHGLAMLQIREPSLLKALATLTCKRISSFKAHEAAMAAWALAKLNQHPRPTLAAIESHLVDNQLWLAPYNMSALLWALAKHGMLTDHLLLRMQLSIDIITNRMTPGQLGNVAWAVSKAARRGRAPPGSDSDLGTSATDVEPASAATSSPGAVLDSSGSHTAAAAAEPAAAPAEALPLLGVSAATGAVARAALQKLNSFDSSSLAQLSTSFAKLLREPGVLDDAARAQAIGVIRAATAAIAAETDAAAAPEETALLLDAMVAAQAYGGPSADAQRAAAVLLHHKTTPLLPMRPGQLASVARSAGRLGGTSPEALARLAKAAVTKLGAFEPGELESLGKGLRMAGHRDPALANALLRRTREMLGNARPGQQVALLRNLVFQVHGPTPGPAGTNPSDSTAAAARKAGARDGSETGAGADLSRAQTLSGLVHRTCNRLAPRLGELKSRELARFVQVCAAVRFRDRVLLGAVSLGLAAGRWRLTPGSCSLILLSLAELGWDDAVANGALYKEATRLLPEMRPEQLQELLVALGRGSRSGGLGGRSQGGAEGQEGNAEVTDTQAGDGKGGLADTKAKDARRALLLALGAEADSRGLADVKAGAERLLVSGVDGTSL